jgi:hypothetical protein
VYLGLDNRHHCPNYRAPIPPTGTPPRDLTVHTPFSTSDFPAKMAATTRRAPQHGVSHTWRPRPLLPTPIRAPPSGEPKAHGLTPSLPTHPRPTGRLPLAGPRTYSAPDPMGRDCQLSPNLYWNSRRIRLGHGWYLDPDPTPTRPTALALPLRTGDPRRPRLQREHGRNHHQLRSRAASTHMPSQRPATMTSVNTPSALCWTTRQQCHGTVAAPLPSMHPLHTSVDLHPSTNGCTVTASMQTTCQAL